ncbi:hypothetical protein EDC94DRAFT_642300 [Helicostylum pulchrum]|uniref:RlpA-like double-psi beta-barrel-protein domain-containing protein-containing protein n=1 Tax=Helicostylum pulchrum TaxID=562976 RepID=A0ABP9YCV1_9FUNG|nr:hypothetical protein EDC94DRAFT_642300 [Helicostylum pulchrum]
MSNSTLQVDVEKSNGTLPDVATHPFGEINDSSSHVSSKFTERDPLITPPPTIWTKFNARFRFGKIILVTAGAIGVFVVMFIVLGVLDVFHNKRYQNEAGISIGKPKYPGGSSGAWETNDMSGQGDGTYYDPGVGLSACGTQSTAEDNIVAMNEHDFGSWPNPNTSPTCGRCVIITGPNGSQKAQVQDICPFAGCGRGSVDLSPAVFAKVGDFFDGRIPITWKQC